MSRRMYVVAGLVFLAMLAFFAGTREAQEEDVAANNKAIVEEIIIPAWNTAELSDEALQTLEDTIAPIWVWHGPLEANVTNNTFDVLTWTFDVWHAAFPDLVWEAKDISADGDMVYWYFTFNGTFEEMLDWGLEIPATGDEVNMEGVFMFRFEDEQVQEMWLFWAFPEYMEVVYGNDAM